MKKSQDFGVWAATAAFVLCLVFLTSPKPAKAGNKVIIDMTCTVVQKTADGKYTGGWDPKRITVMEGDDVLLRIKSADAEHVFTLEGYNIEKDVQPGSRVEVQFKADKPGIFYYHCGMECGPYHKAMIGQFIVNTKQ